MNKIIRILIIVELIAGLICIPVVALALFTAITAIPEALADGISKLTIGWTIVFFAAALVIVANRVAKIINKLLES
jgi:Ca2+/Na+ antiporter